MTKKEALAEFKEYVSPIIVNHFGANDITVKHEAWNNFIYMLREEGRITLGQYENWDNPF